jgi:hypothetical protein
VLEATYLFDAAARLELVHTHLFPSAPQRGPVVDSGEPGGTLWDSLGELHAAVMRRTALDARIGELVRLRCAERHDCKT